MRPALLALALLAAPAFAETPAPKPAEKAAPGPDKAAPKAPAAGDKAAPAADKKPVKVGQFCTKALEGTTQGDLTCKADKKGKLRWQKP